MCPRPRRPPLPAVAAAALVALAGPPAARAKPPPMSETESQIQSNWSDVEQDLEACSSHATARRRFGVAEVAVTYRRRGRPSARLERGHNLGPLRRCVERALAAAKLDRLPP